jgi:hypothetical protein
MRIRISALRRHAYKYFLAGRKRHVHLQDLSPPNAAPEWQARNLGWQSREGMVACPLEGLVRRVAVEANV